MIVKVTQEDIDSGKQQDCERCPVALATRRAIMENFNLVKYYQFELMVTSNFIDILDRNGYKMHCFYVGDYVRKFINAFDSWPTGAAVVPFEFELALQ